MNYITHLNAVFKRFSEDVKLNPTHVSLYMAFFQFWNIYHFPDIFYINREEVMKMSKIGSRSTYSKCLRLLHKQKYLQYFPSFNPYQNSRVKLVKFGQSTGQGPGQSGDHGSGKVVDIALVSNINYIKPIKNIIDIPNSKSEVLDFFEEKNWCNKEAAKFYNHYAAVGWKLGGKVDIKNWRSVAENWVLRAGEKKEGKLDHRRSNSQIDYLKFSKSKNYGKPL